MCEINLLLLLPGKVMLHKDLVNCNILFRNLLAVFSYCAPCCKLSQKLMVKTFVNGVAVPVPAWTDYLLSNSTD